MTTLNEAKEAVYRRFEDEFTLARIVFDNEDLKLEEEDGWARLVIRNTVREQETLGALGSRRFKQSALVFVQVYTETNIGVKKADTLAERAADIFDGKSFSGLDFQAANIRETGPDGKWYQTVVEIPFDYYETK